MSSSITACLLATATLCAASICHVPTAHAANTKAQADKNSHVGKRIGDFSLKSQFGKEYALRDFADRDVVVVAFVGAECPLAQLYGPRLAELARKLDNR